MYPSRGSEELGDSELGEIEQSTTVMAIIALIGITLYGIYRAIQWLLENHQWFGLYLVTVLAVALAAVVYMTAKRHVVRLFER